MLIIGDNLKDLCKQHHIIDTDNAYDVNSLCLRLDDSIKRLVIPNQTIVDYGKALRSEWVVDEVVPKEGLEIARNGPVSGCSREHVHIPDGYFGMVQTKGSLARLFVSVTCNDGQVEAGFRGQVTFELINLGPFKVRIPKNAQVAQLFIFRASTKNAPRYAGKYQNAVGPTEFRPN